MLIWIVGIALFGLALNYGLSGVVLILQGIQDGIKNIPTILMSWLWDWHPYADGRVTYSVRQFLAEETTVNHMMNTHIRHFIRAIIGDLFTHTHFLLVVEICIWNPLLFTTFNISFLEQNLIEVHHECNVRIYLSNSRIWLMTAACPHIHTGGDGSRKQIKLSTGKSIEGFQ